MLGIIKNFVIENERGNLGVVFRERVFCEVLSLVFFIYIYNRGGRLNEEDVKFELE